MTDKRILLINEDGTAEVNGVRVRVVPVEPSREQKLAAMLRHDDKEFSVHSGMANIYRTMLSAATIDLSGLPRVPEKRPLNERDGIDACNACWNDALTAMGVPK